MVYKTLRDPIPPASLCPSLQARSCLVVFAVAVLPLEHSFPGIHMSNPSATPKVLLKCHLFKEATLTTFFKSANPTPLLRSALFLSIALSTF